MPTASAKIPLTKSYTAEGRRLLGLHGTNGRAVRIDAVNVDGEYVDPSDDLAVSWSVCWTSSNGYCVEKTYDCHSDARVIAGVLEGTR